MFHLGCKNTKYPLKIHLINELKNDINVKIVKAYLENSNIKLEISFLNRRKNNVVLELKDNIYIKIGDNYFDTYFKDSYKNFSKELFLKPNFIKTISLESYIGNLNIENNVQKIELFVKLEALDNVSVGDLDLIRVSSENIKEVSLLSSKKESGKVVEKTYYMRCLKKELLIKCDIKSCNLFEYPTKKLILKNLNRKHFINICKDNFDK